MKESGRIRAQLLGSAATAAALLFAAPAFSATGTIDIATLSAISNASLAITSPQNNTAAVSATTSITGTPVAIELAAYTTIIDVATGSFGVSNNTASATATGNTTATPNGNLLDITVLPTFADSGAVTSLQTNIGAVSALSDSVDISATIEGAAATTHELQGTLTVDGNTVSTAGTANTAVNTLRVADSVSVADDGAAGSIVAGTDLATVGADLLVTSVQNSLTGDTVATTNATTIDIAAQSVDVSTVLLEDNRIAATARGNLSTNTVDTGVNSANLDASVAVSNYQRLNASDTTATVSASNLAVAVGTPTATFGVDNSTVGIDTNTTSAAATANSTTQTLNLSANDVLGGALLADLGADVGAGSATGEALISNVQDRTTSNVLAANTGGTVLLTATSGVVGVANDVILDSTLSVTANKAEAVAIGNNATGSMLLDGNTVGGGAGIVSSQAGDASTTTANLTTNAVTLNALDTLETSTAELTGNTQRAVAAGNIVSSSLTVSTNESILTAANGAASASTTGAVIDSNAAYAVGTLQSQLGAVTAAADNGGFTIDADVNVSAASTVANDSNTRVAAAYGNDASSRIAIDATLIETIGFSSVAASVSQQELNAGITARAGGLGVDASVVTTNVDGSVLNSSVSTSTNTVEALAMGNRTTTTSVMVDATTIDTTSIAAATAATTTAGVSSADASFAAVSAQDASGVIIATLRDSTGVDSSWIETTVDGAVTSSSVVSESNTLRAGATANSGMTAVALDATNVNTTASVVNGQESDAAISALIGVSVPAGLNEGGVTMKADGAILNSTLSVASNLTSGSVTGNAGTNSLSVTGTNVGAGSISTIGAVNAVNASATADASLSSTQNALTSVLNSAVYGTFGIDSDTTLASTTVGSTVSVDRNTQAASTIGNTVTNTTLLDGSNVNTTSATTSVQTVGVANIDALSDVDMFVEASAATSDISISANRNQSVAVANDATSTVTATGSNVTTRDASADATASTITNTASADHALLSSQTAAGAVDSSAITDIFNQDIGAVTNNIAASTIAFDSNVTIAESTANRGTNRLVLGGDGASLTATGVASNDQTSAAAVTASVDADVNISMLSAGPAVVAATGSTLSVDGNTSSSTARGNVGTNSLVASGTLISDPTDVAVDATFTAADVVANGSNLLLSNQSQSGAVDANALGTFGVALNNDAATALAATDSSISVSANLLSSMGVANVVTNSASLSGTTVDTSVAVLNGQVSSAAVTGDTTMTLSAVTASSGSTVDMSSNTARAIGVANDATNTASVTGTNVLADSGVGNADINGVTDVLAASNIVANKQAATSTVAANVTLNGTNQEASFTDTLGMATGTVSFDSNVAMAEASSNRATNSLTLGGGALLDATGAVFNDQTNAAAATANATSTLGLTLDSAALATAVLANSTASIDGNSTTALARGNTATNVLNASAAALSSGAGTSVSTLTGTTPTQTLSAGFGILNAQSNTAIVTAAVDNSFYGMALNDTADTGAAVSNSTLSVAGNMVSAQAMGNTGGSSLTLTGLNSSTANAAVGNTQSNTGDVIASIASTLIGSSSYGTLGTSAISIADNVLASAASGNSTTNLLIRN